MREGISILLRIIRHDVALNNWLKLDRRMLMKSLTLEVSDDDDDGITHVLSSIPFDPALLAKYFLPGYVFVRILITIEWSALLLDASCEEESKRLLDSFITRFDGGLLYSRVMYGLLQLWKRKETTHFSGFVNYPIDRMLLKLNAFSTMVEEMFARIEDPDILALRLGLGTIDCFSFDFERSPLGAVVSRFSLDSPTPFFPLATSLGSMMVWKEVGIVATEGSVCSTGGWHREGRYCKYCDFLPCDRSRFAMVSQEQLQDAIFLRSLDGDVSCEGYGQSHGSGSASFSSLDDPVIEKRHYLTCETTGEQYTYRATDGVAHHALKACISLVPNAGITLHDAASSASAGIIMCPCQIHLIVRRNMRVVSMPCGSHAPRSPEYYSALASQMPAIPSTVAGATSSTTMAMTLFVVDAPSLVPILDYVYGEDGACMVTSLYPLAVALLRDGSLIIRSHLPSMAEPNMKGCGWPTW